MDADVGDQVVDATAEELLVAHDHEANRDVAVPFVLGVGRARSLDAVVDQPGDIDRAVGLVGELVETGEAEHVVDESAHALRFKPDPTYGFVHLGALGRALCW